VHKQQDIKMCMQDSKNTATRSPEVAWFCKLGSTNSQL